jgi:hypothetical protein
MAAKKVRLSVYVPPELHRQVKHASIDEGKTLQEVVGDALESVLNPHRDTREKMRPKEVRMWQSQLKRILESGDQLAIQNCTSCIKATVNWLQAEGRLAETFTSTLTPKDSGDRSPANTKRRA